MMMAGFGPSRTNHSGNISESIGYQRRSKKTRRAAQICLGFLIEKHGRVRRKPVTRFGFVEKLTQEPGDDKVVAKYSNAALRHPKALSDFEDGPRRLTNHSKQIQVDSSLEGSSTLVGIHRVEKQRGSWLYRTLHFRN